MNLLEWINYVIPMWNLILSWLEYIEYRLGVKLERNSLKQEFSEKKFLINGATNIPSSFFFFVVLKWKAWNPSMTLPRLILGNSFDVSTEDETGLMEWAARLRARLGPSTNLFTNETFTNTLTCCIIHVKTGCLSTSLWMYDFLHP